MTTSALTIFKQAGIGDYIMQGLQGTGNDAQNYLVRGGAGALAGGLGMGMSSYMNSDEEDEDRGSNALMSGLSGALMGGGVGLGANAIQDRFFRSSDALSPEVQKLKDQAAQKGYNIDTNPYGYNHPTGQMALNLTHGGTAAGAGVGVAAGLSYPNFKDRSGVNAMDKLMIDAKIPPNDHSAMSNHLQSMRRNFADGAKRRFIEQKVQNDPTMGLSEIRSYARDLGVQENKLGNGVLGKLQRSLGFQDDFSSTLSRDMAMNHGNYTPAARGPITDALQRMNPTSAAAYKKLKTIMLKHPGQALQLGTAKRFLTRNAKRGVVGGIVGAGAQMGGKALVDNYIGNAYPQEQLDVWNQSWNR